MTAPILNASKQQLEHAAAKITYLGEQTIPIPSVIFTSKDFRPAPADFVAVHRSGRPYTNDALPATLEFEVAPDEFHRILAAAADVLTRPHAGTGPPFLSFTVIRKADARTEGQEFLISRTHANDFYAALLKALEPTNGAGRTAIEKQYYAVIPSSDRAKLAPPGSNR